MKALIKKELRENLKWAVLGLLLFSVVLAGYLYIEYKNPQGNFPVLYTLLLITAWTCPIAAFSLGLLQTVSETARDQWAFLIHRPLTPTQIFLAKTTAGLSLLVPVIIVPYLAALVWCATPGNLAQPFYASMNLPVIVDLLLAPAFYFAGILVGLRQARWYVSRIFPITLPILTSLLVVNAEFHFAWGILIAILASLIMFAAAWGCFQTGGTWNRQPAVSKTMLAANILASVIIIVSVLGGIFTTITAPERDFRKYQQYIFDKQGHTILTEMSGNQYLSIKDLDDPERVIAFDKSHNTYNNKPFKQLSMSWIPLYSHSPNPFRGIDLQYWRYDPNRQTNEFWYYSQAEQLLLVYNRKSRQFLGYLGPDGFTPAGQQPAKRFDKQIQAMSEVIITSKAAYYIKSHERTVQKLVTVDESNPLFGAKARSFTVLESEPDISKLVWRYYFAYQNHLEIYEQAPNLEQMNWADAKSIFKIPTPHDPTTLQSISIGKVLPDNIFAMQFTPHWRYYNKPSIAMKYAADGTLKSEKQLPKRKRFYNTGPTHRDTVPIALVAPPICIPVAILAEIAFNENHKSTFFRQFKKNPTIVYTGMGIMIFCSLLSGAITYRLARRYAFTKSATITWTIASLLLALPGLFTFLCCHNFPARTPCPACKKPRTVAHDNCEHCDKPFTPPTPDGTEIIAT